MLRTCKGCAAEFESSRKQYCSVECRAAAERRCSKESKARRRAAESQGTFYETLKRVTPGLPTACEACGEDRVLEVAHKYAYKRRGAHATLSNSEWPKMTWILCPTCHRLLDKGIETSAELGLK